MTQKLLLSSSGFPEKFELSNVSYPSFTTKLQYVEEKILNAINNYNPKLNVTSVKYLDINLCFSNLEFGKYGGLIVQESKVVSTRVEELSRDEHYFWKSNDEWFCWRIVVYIFLSDYEVKGRNIVSQTIFPEIIDFMGKYNSSPSYSIANHPIYFLNFLVTEITASSIIKQFAGMIASNIEYIEVFTNNLVLNDVPKGMIEYLEVFAKDYVKDSCYYSSEFYDIDMVNHISIIRTDKLKIDDYIKYKDGQEDLLEFNGSSEKFYWMEVLPIIILSWENGYEVDCTMLIDFYNKNIKRFSERDDKFKRFGYLIKYIEKIMLRGEI